jgi:hypothetical protein
MGRPPHEDDISRELRTHLELETEARVEEGTRRTPPASPPCACSGIWREHPRPSP